MTDEKYHHNGLRKRQNVTVASVAAADSTSSRLNDDDHDGEEGITIKSNSSGSFSLRPTERSCLANNNTESPSSSDNSSKSGLSQSLSFHRWRKFATAVNVFIRLIAILCFSLGFVFRMQLHTGEECHMTYSMREFLPVQTAYGMRMKNSSSSSSTTPPYSVATQSYRLYKFVDQRDPRYQRQLQMASTTNQPLGRTEHCEATYTPVIGGTSGGRSSNFTGTNQHLHIAVYIPGHWGSYTQARSLGAHGIQLTQAREPNAQAIRKMLATPPQRPGVEDDEDVIGKFVYEVYAVDFAEQGGALHGAFLTMQSEFVASVIEQLANDCHGVAPGDTLGPRVTNTITLVAHSMGGYVARWALLRHPELKRHVQNVLTLATPHSNPLYAFEKSVHDIHHQIVQGEDRLHKDADENRIDATDTLILSISGGLRDEMIVPSACQVSHDPNSISVLSTRLMAEDRPPGSDPAVGNNLDEGSERLLLGMDHRAIVWCHQILHQVRKVIWTLAASDHLPVQERRSKVLASLSLNSDWNEGMYTDEVGRLDGTLAKRLGWWKALCTKSSVLYNLPLLLALYGLIAGLQCALASASTIAEGAMNVVVCFAILVGWFFGKVDFPTAVVLALVADAISFALVNLMPLGFLKWKDRSKPDAFPLRTVVMFLSGFFVATSLVGGCLCQLFLGEVGGIAQYWDSILYVCVIGTSYAASVLCLGLSRNDKGGFPNQPFWNDRRRGNADLHFVTWIMVTMPIIMAGPLTLMAWEKTTTSASWRTLLSMELSMGLWLVSKYLSRRPSREGSGRPIQALATAILIVGLCPWTVTPGNGYLAPVLISAVAYVDAGFALVSYTSTTDKTNRMGQHNSDFPFNSLHLVK